MHTLKPLYFCVSPGGAEGGGRGESGPCLLWKVHFSFLPRSCDQQASALVPHRAQTQASNNWDSDQSPEPVRDRIQGGTNHPDLSHLLASTGGANPS